MDFEPLIFNKEPHVIEVYVENIQVLKMKILKSKSKSKVMLNRKRYGDVFIHTNVPA